MQVHTRQWFWRSRANAEARHSKKIREHAVFSLVEVRQTIFMARLELSVPYVPKNTSCSQQIWFLALFVRYEHNLCGGVWILRGKLRRSAFKFTSFIVIKLHNFRFKTINLQWRNNDKAHIFCLCGHSNSYHRWAMELHKVYMSDLCCGSCPNASMPWSYAIHLVQKTLLAKQRYLKLCRSHLQSMHNLYTHEVW